LFIRVIPEPLCEITGLVMKQLDATTSTVTLVVTSSTGDDVPNTFVNGTDELEIRAAEPPTVLTITLSEAAYLTSIDLVIKIGPTDDAVVTVVAQTYRDVGGNVEAYSRVSLKCNDTFYHIDPFVHRLESEHNVTLLLFRLNTLSRFAFPMEINI